MNYNINIYFFYKTIVTTRSHWAPLTMHLISGESDLALILWRRQGQRPEGALSSKSGSQAFSCPLNRSRLKRAGLLFHPQSLRPIFKQSQKYTNGPPAGIMVWGTASREREQNKTQTPTINLEMPKNEFFGIFHCLEVHFYGRVLALLSTAMPSLALKSRINVRKGFMTG